MKTIAMNHPSQRAGGHLVLHMAEAADRVVEFGVFTTPFIAIDGRVEFVGVPRESELRERINAVLAAPGITD